MPIIGGGVEKCFGGVDILFGAVIANIGGGSTPLHPPPPQKIRLWVRARQLASVAQLVRALHRNRRAAGSIPARDA